MVLAFLHKPFVLLRFLLICLTISTDYKINRVDASRPLFSGSATVYTIFLQNKKMVSLVRLIIYGKQIQKLKRAKRRHLNKDYISLFQRFYKKTKLSRKKVTDLQLTKTLLVCFNIIKMKESY